MGLWTRLSLRHPRVALALLAVVTAGLGLGLPDVRPEHGYRVLIGAEHPAIVRLEAFIDTFGGGQPINIAWKCGEASACGHPLDRHSVEMAHDIGRQLASLPSVRRVASLANTSVIVPDSHGFAVRHLVEDGAIAADFQALVGRASEDPLWRGTLINDDATAGAIRLQTADTSPPTEAAVTDAVLAAIAPYEADGIEFFISGAPIGSVVAGRALGQSVARLIPVLVLVIGLILLALSRSWKLSVVVLLSMGVALLWTYGLLGWLQWPEDGILQVLAPLVLTVGVCDGVHFATRATEIEAGGRPRRDSLIEAASDVGGACLVTTATTCAAFLSFTTSELDTFVRFGFISAFGVVACLATTFTLLPVLALGIGEARGAAIQRTPTRLADAIQSLTTAVRRHPLSVIATASVLTALSLAGMARLNVDNDWIKSFGKGSEVGRWEAGFREAFGHSSSIDITFTLPSSDLLVDPASFSALNAIADRVEDTTPFSRPVGLSDAVARLNRALHEDDPAYNRTGTTRRANAELIEMLAFDDPRTLDTWLSIDRKTIRLGFDSPLDAQAEREPALAEARHAVEALLPAGWTYAFEGEAPTHSHFVGDVLGTQIRSFPAAALLVWLLVCFFFRSIPLGTAALVPTLLPVAWTLGLMGWAGMDLDIGRSMVAAVVIGIGVDDSVHLLGRYQVARQAGHNIEAAMVSAIDDCGRALVTTSLALAAGFLVLRLAAWETISSFGVLVAFTISVALVCTLAVIPALFALAERPIHQPEQATPHRESAVV